MAATISTRSTAPTNSRPIWQQPADTDRYFIEYADYRSADGFFRKYRFIFVDDQVLPYHLAICDDWKVHHVNTDMANQIWMQQEEAAFLNDPARVFNERHYQALREIQQRIGLEYFGIDCGIDTDGDSAGVRGQRLDAGARRQRANFPTRTRPSAASRRRSMRCWRGLRGRLSEPGSAATARTVGQT